MEPSLTKILCVDDESDIRTIIKFALERKGHFTVQYCSSGQEAISVVEEFRPDLILLDIMMPVMDGVSTFYELRKLPVTKDTPVVFITAKSQRSEIEQFKKIGAVDVITKPFSAATLSDQLLEIWSNYLCNNQVKTTS